MTDILGQANVSLDETAKQMAVTIINNDKTDRENRHKLVIAENRAKEIGRLFFYLNAMLVAPTPEDAATYPLYTNVFVAGGPRSHMDLVHYYANEYRLLHGQRYEPELSAFTQRSCCSPTDIFCNLNLTFKPVTPDTQATAAPKQKGLTRFFTKFLTSLPDPSVEVTRMPREIHTTIAAIKTNGEEQPNYVITRNSVFRFNPTGAPDFIHFSPVSVTSPQEVLTCLIAHMCNYSLINPATPPTITGTTKQQPEISGRYRNLPRINYSGGVC